MGSMQFCVEPIFFLVKLIFTKYSATIIYGVFAYVENAQLSNKEMKWKHESLLCPIKMI